MRNLILVSVSLLLASQSSFGEGVSWDGGGAQGGNGRVFEIKADARSVYRKLEAYLAQSLAVDRERAALTPEEFGWLEKIKATFEEKRRFVPRLFFGTADKNPKELGGKTGPIYALWTRGHLGDDLWLNLDYADGQPDYEIAASLMSGLAIQLGLAGQEKIDQFQQDVMVTMETEAAPDPAGG